MKDHHNKQIKLILFEQKNISRLLFLIFKNIELLKCVMKQTLVDQCLQNRNTLVQNTPQGINYKDFTKKIESKKSFNILDFKDAVVDFEQLILNCR